MPLNEKRIISIILEQSTEAEERCKGYRDEIINVISEIIEYEWGHLVSPTNIQKKIKDKCNAAGQFLAMERDKDAGAEELRP